MQHRISGFVKGQELVLNPRDQQVRIDAALTASLVRNTFACVLRGIRCFIAELEMAQIFVVIRQQI